MSYILEALADSEQARQQLAAAPRRSLLQAVGEDMPRTRVWPYALAGALLVNVAVLQLWLRPALPGGVASIKGPTLPRAVEAPLAAAEPRIAPAGESAKAAANLADIVSRDTGLPPSQPERVNDPRMARLPAPAVAAPRTLPENSANYNAPIPMTIVLAPKARAKPSAGVAAAVAATPAAVPSATAPVAVATAATPASVPVAAAPAAVATAAANTQVAPAPASGTDLPPALQRELPALSVAGFIRDEGSSSMVIVNDRLIREGDEVAPGVKLEKISGDSLVFNYKGYRFKR